MFLETTTIVWRLQYGFVCEARLHASHSKVNHLKFFNRSLMLFLVFCAFLPLSFLVINIMVMVVISSSLMLAALRRHTAYTVLIISIITEFCIFQEYSWSGTTVLTLYVPIQENGQTNSNDSSQFTDELFEFVWPFFSIAT